MGGCSSKVVAVSTLPPQSNTESRSISYDVDNVIDHVYKKEKLASAIKSEFDTYKRNLRLIEEMVKTDTKFLLTEYFYNSQEKKKEKIKLLLESMKLYDDGFVKIYKKKFEEFEKSYRGYVLYLYTSDKLTIDDSLLTREDVKMFFGICKRVVTFFEKPTVITN
jgi:hypothetical protein